MKLKCIRCGKEWKSRKLNPKRCAICRRRTWNKAEDPKQIRVSKYDILHSIVCSRLIIGLIRLKYVEGRKNQQTLAKITGMNQSLISVTLRKLKKFVPVDAEYNLDFETILQEFIYHIDEIYQKQKNYYQKTDIRFKDWQNPCEKLKTSKNLKYLIGTILAEFMVTIYYKDINMFGAQSLKGIFDLYIKYLLEKMPDFFYMVERKKKDTPLLDDFFDFGAGLREITSIMPYGYPPTMLRLLD